MSKLDDPSGVELGRATVVRARDTETLDGPNPLIDLEITISVGNRPPYTVARREPVPRVYLGRVAPGASVPVSVNPTDPTDIAILWSRP
ncbi:MAG: hypothetical protein ACRDJV_14550 [Actinomycetota bacterium]